MECDSLFFFCFPEQSIRTYISMLRVRCLQLLVLFATSSIETITSGFPFRLKSLKRIGLHREKFYSLRSKYAKNTVHTITMGGKLQSNFPHKRVWESSIMRANCEVFFAVCLVWLCYFCKEYSKFAELNKKGHQNYPVENFFLILFCT